MALGAMSAVSTTAKGTTSPLFADLITFKGDGAYPTNGTADFQDAYRVLAKSDREILAVIGQDCGGYVVAYDKANDKLKVYTGDYNPAADSPLVECDNAENLSAVDFTVLVIAR